MYFSFPASKVPAIGERWKKKQFRFLRVMNYHLGRFTFFMNTKKTEINQRFHLLYAVKDNLLKYFSQDEFQNITTSNSTLKVIPT